MSLSKNTWTLIKSRVNIFGINSRFFTESFHLSLKCVDFFWWALYLYTILLIYFIAFFFFFYISLQCYFQTYISPITILHSLCCQIQTIVTSSKPSIVHISHQNQLHTQHQVLYQLFHMNFAWHHSTNSLHGIQYCITLLPSSSHRLQTTCSTLSASTMNQAYQMGNSSFYSSPTHKKHAKTILPMF